MPVRRKLSKNFAKKKSSKKSAKKRSSKKISKKTSSKKQLNKKKIGGKDPKFGLGSVLIYNPSVVSSKPSATFNPNTWFSSKQSVPVVVNTSDNSEYKTNFGLVVKIDNAKKAYTIVLFKNISDKQKEELKKVWDTKGVKNTADFTNLFENLDGYNYAVFNENDLIYAVESDIPPKLYDTLEEYRPVVGF